MSDEPLDLTADRDVVTAFTPGTPLVQSMTIDGGYAGAVISQQTDPGGFNLGDIVKTRLVTAPDANTLKGRVVSCLISEFGMDQADAGAVPQALLADASPAMVA